MVERNSGAVFEEWTSLLFLLRRRETANTTLALCSMLAQSSNQILVAGLQQVRKILMSSL